jgi:hypothetical protein
VVDPRDTGPQPDPAATPGARITSFDWWFRNRRTGAITIAQFPNLPLVLFLVATVAGWFVGAGSTARIVADWIAAGALGWWALDELVRGVNPWRRVLGVGGLALTAIGVSRLV